MRNERWRLVLVSMGKKKYTTIPLINVHAADHCFYMHTHLYINIALLYICFNIPCGLGHCTCAAGQRKISAHPHIRKPDTVVWCFFFFSIHPEEFSSPPHSQSYSCTRMVYNSMYFMFVVYILFIAF